LGQQAFANEISEPVGDLPIHWDRTRLIQLNMQGRPPSHWTHPISHYRPCATVLSSPILRLRRIVDTQNCLFHVPRGKKRSTSRGVKKGRHGGFPPWRHGRNLLRGGRCAVALSALVDIPDIENHGGSSGLKKTVLGDTFTARIRMRVARSFSLAAVLWAAINSHGLSSECVGSRPRLPIIGLSR
jgi:hypothetical protein